MACSSHTSGVYNRPLQAAVLDTGTHADGFYHYTDLLSTLSSLHAVQLQLADHVLHVEFCRAEDC